MIAKVNLNNGRVCNFQDLEETLVYEYIFFSIGKHKFHKSRVSEDLSETLDF